MNPEGPKKDVLPGLMGGSSRKSTAKYERIACSLYTDAGPTFFEKIGTFLDGYGSSLRSRALRPRKRDPRTLPIN